MSQYDALLVVSFGGPEGPDDVVPFLANVTRGRGIPEERLREVGQHYFHFGGVSPINAQNRALVGAVREELAVRRLDLPVYWGNRNWTPTLPEAMRQMQQDGVRRVLAFFTSAYSSYSGCRQYREDLAAAVADLEPPTIAVDRLGPYFNHAGFVRPFVDATAAALDRLPRSLWPDTALVFTTHSLPLALASSSGPSGDAYVRQHEEVARLVGEAVADRTARSWPSRLVFQSRSGPPTQPWLEPDVGDYLEQLATDGIRAAVVVPIGFVSDHMEVVWDLDTQARQRAEHVGLRMERAATPGTDPRFVAMVVDLVQERLVDAAADVRPRLGSLGPAPDRCVARCCPNPRGSLPTVAGDG